MITKEGFLKLTRDQREKVVAELFAAKFKGFRIAATSLDITIPAGYSVRVAAVLQCEEQDEIVKKVFVVMEEFNDFIMTHDLEEIYGYVKGLEGADAFVVERDDFWLVTNEEWTYEAYNYSRGKIALMDLDMLIQGIKKYYDGSRDLRDALRHYGLIKKDTNSKNQ